MFELTIIILAFFFTFYFSGTETAFVSVNRVRIEVWRRQKVKSAETISRFLKRPERFIYTTLIGNNIANVAFASFATIYFNRYLDEKLTWFFITGLTIMWGEIIPKTLFRSLADWIIRKVAYLLNVFYVLFQPVIWLVGYLSGLILRTFHQSEKEITEFFSKKDVEILITESQNYVQIDERKNRILRSLLNLRLLRLRDAMIPRTEIVAVSETVTVDELTTVFHKSGFTRIPVFRKNLDDIIGIVFVQDLFRRPQTIQEITRDVLFVPETKYSLSLLHEFRKNNTTIAIVVDEYGGTGGLITVEDLVEEIVGEIEDEFDASSVLLRKVDRRTYSINVRIEPQQLHEELGIELPEGNYDTLAGFILTHLGHIPKRDEEFEYEGIKFIITRATRRKVENVRLILPEKQ